MNDMTQDNLNERPSFNDALEALRKGNEPTHSRTLLYGLVDLSPQQTNQLRETWRGLDASYRHELLQSLVSASELNFELQYDALGFMALDDPDGDVRARAVELLWENNSRETLRRLVRAVNWDDEEDVRSEAAKALGRFILLGEYEDIPEDVAQQARDAAIQALNDPNEVLEVKRRALEAIANSGHEIVPEAIKDAYTSGERLMRISAVFAMGRTCDKRWRDEVLREMQSGDAEFRFEAARAAGEIQLEEAVPLLTRMIEEEDREIQVIAIWSLGEIGGNEAMRVLERVAEAAEEAEDDDLLETVDEAIGNASLMSGDLLLFDIDDDFDVYGDDFKH